MNISHLHPADQLVLYMQRIYSKGLTTTSGGNLSVMDGDGNIWITPAAVDKGSLTRGDIVCVCPDGTCIGAHKPSSELPFHRAVYAQRPELKAVLHAHCPALVSFSMARKLPSLELLPALEQICGKVALAPYAAPGSQALGQAIGSAFAGGCHVAILENHGVCVAGENLADAFRRFESAEYAARLELLSRIPGIHPHITEQRNPPLPAFAEDPALSIPSPEEQAARRELIAFIRRACDHDLITSAMGTFSLRLPDGSFLITPDSQDRAYLQEADLVRVLDGRAEPGKHPSSTAALHRLIYRLSPETHAILQACPLHAMAFAVTDLTFDPYTIPEAYVMLRDLRKFPRDVLPEALAAHLKPTSPAAMIQNHCAIVTGGHLLQAFDRLEVLECTARSILDSLRLGGAVGITQQEVAELKKVFHLPD